MWKEILRLDTLTCVSFSGQMVKCGWSVVFLATLILLPPAAWGRELLDSQEEGEASGLNSTSALFQPCLPAPTLSTL